MTTPRVDSTSALSRNEQVLTQAFVFFRLGGLAQIAVAIALTTSLSPALPGTALLAAAVTAENALLIMACLRQGGIKVAWAQADLAFNCAGLAAGAALTAPADGHSWAYFMYPFTMLTSIGIGLAWHRPRQVAGYTAVLAGSYMASAIFVLNDPLWNTLPNTFSYFGNTMVAWAVAGTLRRAGRDVDAARAAAVARADELSAERERLRHARMLHDRVLQTMETLAHGDHLGDPDLRAHVIAEAGWLRSLIEGAPGDDLDLSAALHSVINRTSWRGLRVRLNDRQLRGAERLRKLPHPAIEAVTGAVHEALTNVAKHSGSSAAVVHTATDDGELVVSILDHGRGFEPATSHQGIGVAQSIKARISGIGGTARIDSALGAGTYVELRVPLDGPLSA